MKVRWRRQRPITTLAEVNLKIKKAYCPPKIAEGNPCLEYIKYIVLPWFGKFEVTRPEPNGGDKVFTTMEELIADYESGSLHPGDVKPALAKAINKILQPMCDHFKNDKTARHLLKAVKMEWSQPKTQGAYVTPRGGHAGTSINGHWYIVGGVNNKSATVRKEIQDETGRSKAISRVPIHLSVYSPHGKVQPTKKLKKQVKK